MRALAVKFFRARGWHKNEPGESYPAEQPQLFEQWVFHALAEYLISESKAAELLRLPLVEFHAMRNMGRPPSSAPTTPRSSPRARRGFSRLSAQPGQVLLRRGKPRAGPSAH